MVAQLLVMVLRGPESPGGTGIEHGWYIALLVTTYACVYLLPVWIATACLLRIGGPAAQTLALFIAWLGASIVQVLLTVDRLVFELFAFHLNGFVWNLLVTPGGFASMDAGTGSMSSAALVLAGWSLAQALLLAVAWWWSTRPAAATGHPEHADAAPARRMWLIACAFLVATTGERLAYGWASIQGDGALHALAHRLPLYVPTTFAHLAARMGIAAARAHSGAGPRIAGADGLFYPLHPLRARAPERPPNIVLLVCESLRADALTPVLMPATWAMAAHGLRFTHHYSGGNGTRVGMFTLFYGVYGHLWHQMLAARRSPVLMDRLQALGYELRLQTSARFTYPEFDRTLFVNVPRAALHEDAEGPGWARDRRNVTRFERWLEHRDAGRPFMYFQFLESPHARYEFPPESIVARPFLPDLDYLTLDRERDMPLVRNRYLNAVHHLDSQLGRVFAALERAGELGRTVVIVTGDHGEEFMEKGHWGHNSYFTEEQTRVPLVLYMPGVAPRVVDTRTSHLDVAPTLLPLLGVTNPATDYAQGVSLLSQEVRPAIVFADWNHLGVLIGGYKFSLATEPSAAEGGLAVTTSQDRPLSAADRQDPRGNGRLMAVLREASRFQHASRPPIAVGPGPRCDDNRACRTAGPATKHEGTQP